MAKHYDNKNDLLREMRRLKNNADNAVSATFATYMLLACTVLYEDFEYDQENIEAFRDGIYRKLAEYENGTFTVKGAEKALLDNLGVLIEKPVSTGI